MAKTTSIYPRGHFFQQLAGGFEVNAAEMVSSRGFFGLVPSATFLYGCLRSDDGEMFEVVRRFSHHGKPMAAPGETIDESVAKPPSLLLVQSTEVDRVNLRYDMERMQTQASSDDFEMGMDGGDAYWRSKADAKGRPYKITFNEERCSWHEEGRFSISGSIMKPGLQWYLPGRDYGTFYASQLFDMQGEFEGRRVRGIIAFDQNWMAPGADLYRSKDLVIENKGHLVWYTWGTRYDDGSWEGGHFMLGNGPLGFALFTDGKTITHTQDIKGFVTPCADSPFAERIDLVIDGEQWLFTPDVRGKMPDMLRKHPPTPQQEGLWQRVGETRKPVAWFAWGETEPHHGRIPVDHLPTEPITLQSLQG